MSECRGIWSGVRQLASPRAAPRPCHERRPSACSVRFGPRDISGVYNTSRSVRVCTTRVGHRPEAGARRSEGAPGRPVHPEQHHPYGLTVSNPRQVCPTRILACWTHRMHLYNRCKDYITEDNRIYNIYITTDRRLARVAAKERQAARCIQKRRNHLAVSNTLASVPNTFLVCPTRFPDQKTCWTHMRVCTPRVGHRPKRRARGSEGAPGSPVHPEKEKSGLRFGV